MQLVLMLISVLFTGIIVTLTFIRVSGYSFNFGIFLLLSSLLYLAYGQVGSLLYVGLFIAVAYVFIAEKASITLVSFYFLYSLVSNLIIYSILSSFLAGENTSQYLSASLNWLEALILPLLIYLIQFFVLKFFKPSLNYFANHILVRSRLQSVITELILLSYIFLRFSTLANKTLIASLVLLLLATYIYCITLYFQSQALKQAKATELQNLIEYTTQIENLYAEMRHFKHDYKNILLSLEYCLDNNDLAGAKKVYQQTIAPTRSKLSSNLQVIGQLQNITDPALKGLISNKLLLCLTKELKLSCEVDTKITLDRRIQQVDMIRVLSILLDNALQAAESSLQKRLTFAFFEDSSQQIFIIQNSTKEEKINLQLLNKAGFTTKGKGHGQGLANIRAILHDYPFITLNTSSSAHLFQQELIIQGGGAVEDRNS